MGLRAEEMVALAAPIFSKAGLSSTRYRIRNPMPIRMAPAERKTLAPGQEVRRGRRDTSANTPVATSRPIGSPT
jgi:hypothetical protein